jgi:UDPglucose 6-dehydrogenase
MNIAVIGLWHLGCVTAACLANASHSVIGYDPDVHTIQSLRNGKTPIFEPGLDDVVSQGMMAKKLHFTSDLNDLNQADILWITFDTPVDDNDIADVTFVMTQITSLFPYLKPHTLVMISSQLPVGSTRQLQQLCAAQFPEKKITFAYSPENLRLGKAIEVFTHPDRVIVGLETEQDKERITQLLKPFTDKIIWMSIESAEMTKHALNAFLATSVVFINELAMLCERTGANAREVEQGLKSEERIGPKAYLRPGNAIAGGTLARDVNYLIHIAKEKSLNAPLFSALLTSNHAHKQWSCRRILDVFKDIKDKTITTLGLAYKSGTDTLRRSTAIETCQWLAEQGAKVVAYDPSLKNVPHSLTRVIDLKLSLHAAIENSDAVIIATECPEFINLTAEQLLINHKQPCIFDASGFLEKNLGHDKRIRYFTVGRNV